MSTDGDDPKDKKPQPPSTLAGVVPQQPPGRPGLPPPRSTHGGPPPPRRPGAPTGAPRPSTPTGAPRPFSQSQPSDSQVQPASGPHAAPAQAVPEQASSPHAAPTAPHGAATAPHAAPPQQSTPHQATPSPKYQQPAAPSQPASPQWSPAQQSGAQPPSPFAAAPQNDPAWAQGFSNQSRGGIPEARLVESESSPIEQLADMAAEVPGRFMAFLKLSAKRAFRIRIEPSEVLPDERQMLLASNPPVTDENQQAFLAWRRSVLFLVATILTLLSIMGLVDSFNGYKVAASVRFVKLFPTLAECAFCLICWLSLRHWTQWRKQRRWLFIGWLLFMLTPFVVFMYPLERVVHDARQTLTAAQLKELGYDPKLVYNHLVAPFAFAMIALLQLAPKVISLMPGLIRSSLVIKLLFPGASAPGWLIVMAAPLYAMIFYAILIIPYQFSGSGWFIFGLLLIMIAQGLITRAGFRLAKPLTQEEALKHITTVRKFYIMLLVTGLVSIVGGLGLLVQLLHLKWTTVVTSVLKFETNVMILTTIGADLVMTNLDRARGYTEGKEHIEEETEQKIAAFVGLNAPPTPPPSGPAPF